MSSEKKKKVKKKDKHGQHDSELSKEEKAIAKQLRLKCPTKETSVMGDQVHYFQGSKAVDFLLDSRLLQKGCFYRARKLVQRQRQRGEADGKSKDDLRRDLKKKDKDDEKEKKKDVAEEKQKKKDEKKKEDEDKRDKDEDEDEKDDDKKKKRKVKLLPHDDQFFVDSTDVFVWVFEATSTWSYVIGLLIGSIGVCMFPLWPAELRLGVYYLSMCAVGFISVILSLVVVRTILFGAVWVATLGAHHFWLLPNLTEDCGFFESFKPAYQHKHFPRHRHKKDDDADAPADDDKDKESSEEKEENVSSEESGEGKRNGTSSENISEEEDNFEMVEPAT